MDTQKQRLTPGFSQDAADKIIRAQDGEAALLYLYLCSTGSVLELSAAARILGRTEGQIAAAAGKLRALGSFPRSAAALPQGEELPDYAPEEISRRGGEDPAFRSLIAEAQRSIGHMLSTGEMKTLFGVYDHLGLPPEVILLLINHCDRQYRKKYGENRRPTMRAIEREAFAWVNREIMTLELAEAHISRQDIRDQALQQVRSALGICDRALSSTERRYVEGWLEQGFPPESIELAYDRTVTNTGSLKWRYMDAIIQGWSAKGLFTPEDIQRGEPRNARSGRKQAEVGDAREQVRMERLLEKLREER